MKYCASVLILCLIVNSCGYKNTRNNEASFLPSDLNQVRQLQDNKQVYVRGYLIYEPGNYNVWDSRQAMNSGDLTKCISMVSPSVLRTKLVSANRKNVYLKGIFKNDITEKNKVYLGLCNYLVYKVCCCVC